MNALRFEFSKGEGSADINRREDVPLKILGCYALPNTQQENEGCFGCYFSLLILTSFF
jgi:hypothetical protein